MTDCEFRVVFVQYNVMAVILVIMMLCLSSQIAGECVCMLS
jgi:hypothetical protein